MKNVKSKCGTSGVSNIQRTVPVTITSSELMAKVFPELDFAIPGLFPVGLNLLAGKPKMKKSFFCLDAVSSLASGGQFLGFIDIPQPQTALYLALEDSVRRLKSRLLAISGDTEGNNRLHFKTEWPRMGEGCMEDLEAWVAANPTVRLITIDTYNKIRGLKRPGSSIYEKDDLELTELKKFADKHKLAILLVHHLRKSDNGGLQDMVSGSIGIVGAPDTIAIMEKIKGKGNAILHIYGRDVEDNLFNLKFNTQSISWELATSENEMSPERTEILEIIEKAKKPMKLSDIATTVGKKLTTTYKLVSGLVDGQYLKKTSYGFYEIHSEKEQPDCNNTELGTGEGTVLTIDPNEDLQKMVESLNS